MAVIGVAASLVPMQSIPNLCPDINALVDPVLSPPPPNQLSSSPSQTFYLTTTTGQALDPGQSFQCQLLNRTVRTYIHTYTHTHTHTHTLSQRGS